MCLSRCSLEDDWHVVYLIENVAREEERKGLKNSACMKKKVTRKPDSNMHLWMNQTCGKHLSITFSILYLSTRDHSNIHIHKHPCNTGIAKEKEKNTHT
jgi:hypothetical protein